MAVQVLAQFAGLLMGWAWVGALFRRPWRTLQPGLWQRPALVLAAACLGLGLLLSDSLQQALQAVFFLTAGTLGLLVLGAGLPWAWPGRPGRVWAGLVAALLVATVGVKALFLSLPARPWNEMGLGLFLCLRPNRANDIEAGSFHAWDSLGVVAGAGALAWIWLRWAWSTRRRDWALLLLLPLALAVKLAVACLSGDGLQILGLKVLSQNNGFLRQSGALRALGAWRYAEVFPEIQKYVGFHVDTHPFLPNLVYGGLWKLADRATMVLALWVAGFNAVAAPLLALLAWRLSGQWKAALCAGLLWALSPFSAILSGAGADAFTVPLVLVCLLAFDAALRGSLAAALGAGLALAAASFFSFSVPALFLCLALWAWSEPGRRPAAALKPLLACGAAAVAPHLLLWALSRGAIDYLASMRLALGIHGAMNAVRPYGLWSWLNLLLFAAYAGWGTVAAALPGWAAWDGRVGLARLNAAAWPLLMVLALAALGKAEVQRQFIFLGPSVVLAATAFVLRLPKARQRGWITGLAALGLLQCALLEILVLDFW